MDIPDVPGVGWRGRGRMPSRGRSVLYQWFGAGIAHWLCVGFAVLLDAALWVCSFSGENFSGTGDFSLGVNIGYDSIPRKLFRMRV